MDVFIITLLAVSFVVALVYYFAKDETDNRDDRNMLRRSAYEFAHRKRHSVWQRAGHVYGGDEYGPFGKAVVVTIGVGAGILSIALFVENCETASLLPLIFWAFLVKDKMNWG